MARKVISSIAILMLLAVGSARAGDLYGGVKLGLVDPAASGFDSISTASLQVGYEFAGLWVFDAAVEGELTRSLADADGPGGDYSYAENSIFRSLRTAGPVYFITRVGLVDAKIDQASGSRSDDAVAYGVGIGFSTGIRWELEWTTYDFDGDDVDRISFQLSF